MRECCDQLIDSCFLSSYHNVSDLLSFSLLLFCLFIWFLLIYLLYILSLMSFPFLFLVSCPTPAHLFNWICFLDLVVPQTWFPLHPSLVLLLFLLPSSCIHFILLPLSQVGFSWCLLLFLYFFLSFFFSTIFFNLTPSRVDHLPFLPFPHFVIFMFSISSPLYFVVISSCTSIPSLISFILFPGCLHPLVSFSLCFLILLLI